jgi:hypothetical protein
VAIYINPKREDIPPSKDGLGMSVDESKNYTGACPNLDHDWCRFIDILYQVIALWCREAEALF